MLHRILIVGGGSGGHVFPALALAEALQTICKAEIVFAVRAGSLEEKLTASRFRTIPIPAWPFRRGKIFVNLNLPWKTFTSIIRAAGILRKEKPDFVLSTGGYTAFALAITAGLMHIPCYIHEQNAVPGLTNRLTASVARKIYTSSPQAAQKFGKKAAPVYGTPIRRTMDTAELIKPADYDAGCFHILVLGGSQGAPELNSRMLNILDFIESRKNLKVWWQTGKRHYQALVNTANLPGNVQLFPFIENVIPFIKHSDLVISRAGASSLAEFYSFGKALILVPYPYSAGRHQEENAKSAVNAGAALLELPRNENRLAEKITRLMTDKNKLQSMKNASVQLAKPDAADNIAADIIRDISKTAPKT
jgi:UDP-N-acetylglucosamine--N-acetylmuramyl-(pentapeptide) pyrophosphoryl-undecaprenol N-acetylglucosamine transferase